MCRLLRVICLRALWAVLALVCTSNAQSPNSTLSIITGEWRSGTIDGVYNDPQQPGCSVFSFLERTILINHVPGTQAQVRGIWRRHSISVWLNNPNGTCKWPTASSLADTYESTFIYAITGTFELLTRTLSFETSFRNCFGNACEKAMLTAATRQRLKQSLQIRGDARLEANLEGQTLVFLRTADAVELEIVAKKAASVYEKLFDEGQFDELIRNFSSIAIGPGALPLDGLKQFRQNIGPIVLRVPLSQFYASAWAAQPNKPANLVLLIRQVQVTDNRRGAEFMVLRQEGEQWKIDSMLFH